MATDTLFGTWNHDVNLSTFAPGPGPEKHTRKYEQAGDGFKVTVDEVRGGQAISWSYTAHDYDGNDYPVQGRTDADSIASYRLSETQTLGIFKKDGRDIAFYKRTRDAAGTLTVIETGADDGNGRPYFERFVFRKQ
jgi:hypothetical protein